jgi:hypothetical protein
MLGDPRYQTEIMDDEHQREALPPQIVGQSHDDRLDGSGVTRAGWRPVRKSPPEPL